MHALIILSLFCSLQASDFGSSLKNFKGAFSGGGGIVEGAEQSIGIVNGYSYNYRVFNSTPVPIGVASQRVTPVMGANFNGDIKASAIIAAFSDSGTFFNDQQLYLDVWILHTNSQKNEYAAYGTNIIKSGTLKGVAVGAAAGSIVPGLGTFLGAGVGSAIGALVGSIEVDKKLANNKIFHKKIALGKKADENIYYYHVYLYKGKLQAEYLGIATTSSDFNGVFYNNSQKEVKLQFKKGLKDYEVTLEPQSFNLLSSSPQESIRNTQPASFNFLYEKSIIASIPINQYGIATMDVDPKSDPFNPTFIKGAPYTYTYEVHDNTVSMQGLAIGNHTQAGTAENTLRDINPIECNFLVYSPAAYNKKLSDKNSIQNAYDNKGHYWCAYVTKDMSIYQELSIDSITTLKLLRPQLSEKTSSLYVILTTSTDATKIKLFLKRLSEGIVKQDNVVINDTVSGIQAVVVLSDIFYPTGLGSGPYYYTLYPVLLNLEALSSPLKPFIDQKKFSSPSLLSDTLIKWVSLKESLSDQMITDFIGKYAYDQVAHNPLMIKQLSNIMRTALSNLPYTYQAGSNNYLYEQSNYPSHWPDYSRHQRNQNS